MPLPLHHSFSAEHLRLSYVLVLIIFHIQQASPTLSVLVTPNTNSCNALRILLLKSSPGFCHLLYILQ